MSATTSNPLFLSLRNASFRLGDRLVFDNTSLAFRRHEQWAIIGPNGSGKSLLADALRGRLPLVGGELQYHFRPPAGLSPEEAISHVSFEGRKQEVHETVVQSRWNSLEEEGALLVRDFLSYERIMDLNPFEVTDRHQAARPQFERRRRRALALLRVEPFLDRTLLSLSNGETQRVQLARALCHPLRLLVLDEPFIGLDAATRGYFQWVLEDLMKTSLQVLLVTTRGEDLPRHVTHLLHVDQCRVVAAGPVEKFKVRRPKFKVPAPELHPDIGPKPPGKGTRPTTSQGSIKPSDRHSADWQSAVSPIANRRNSRLPTGATVEPDAGRGRSNGAPTLVELREVTVRYGESIILDKLNWTVRAGQSWALLGPNGSGKTTLLSLIQGDHPQAYGNHVVVFGRPRGTGESIWELKRQIGWVSPELHLHFNDAVTCFEVVCSGFHESIGLFEAPTARQRATARRWLTQFGLLEFADTPLYGLSAGLQRMVLLARALVKAPRLLILDEPCQGLDAAHRKLFIRTIDRLIRAGAATVIYVTHRADELPPSIKQVLRLPIN